MKLIETTQYIRTKKYLLKKYTISKVEIDETLNLFLSNKYHPSLHYKKMSCKKDKNRYSIRIKNTQYRILMNVESDIVYLICVCSHDEYDRLNKNC